MGRKGKEEKVKIRVKKIRQEGGVGEVLGRTRSHTCTTALGASTYS